MARARRLPILWSLAPAVFWLPGCSLPGQEVGFESSDPQARLLALREAAATGDRSAIPHIIGMLDSDDPGMRMLAQTTLERMTGETMGYDHSARERDRREAIDRWIEWWRTRPDAPSNSPDRRASIAAAPR